MKKFLVVLGVFLLIFCGAFIYNKNFLNKIPILTVEEETIKVDSLYIYGTHLNFSGDYTLTETVAPTGYIKTSSPIAFTIDATADYALWLNGGTSSELTNVTITGDYDDVYGLRLEAVEKLKLIKPANIGQASRISGVSPADISVLLIYLSK